MNIVYSCIIGILAYLIGSISSSILIGKTKGIDVRNYGSGNAGTTNTMRTLGKKMGALVLIIDILKGIVAVLLGKLLLGETGEAIALFFVVVGHNFPIYFGFRGGKGVATAIGGIGVINPLIIFIILSMGILIIVLTRYVSLASVSAAIIFIILVICLKEPTYIIVFSVLTAGLVIFRHRTNIKRLCNGTESKFGQKVEISK